MRRDCLRCFGDHGKLIVRKRIAWYTVRRPHVRVEVDALTH